MITPEKFNKIVNKLPKDKTELAKVELAIADDIKTIIGTIKQKVKEMSNGEKEAAEFKKRIDKIFKEADKAENRLVKLADSGDKLYNKSVSLVNKAEKAAKDLGVDPSNIGGYGELRKVLDDLDVGSVELRDKAITIY
tara:strand:- start:1679 stop:2092 length:414 start_codon:yes stop_codon:yes gene_type:complete